MCGLDRRLIVVAGPGGTRLGDGGQSQRHRGGSVGDPHCGRGGLGARARTGGGERRGRTGGARIT